MKNRIIITGANGMLGQRAVEYYSSKENIELLASSVEDKSVIDSADYISCDIKSRDKIKKVIYDYCPDFIIHTAAFTNVDLSEKMREDAWKINVKGVEYIAEAARAIDAQIIHISTDYIFDGKNGPYHENDLPNPIGYYGRTKLASENALKISGTLFTILRTNVLYGFARNSRPDFVRWVINSLTKKERIRIVKDQINNPTFIDDLVQAINKIIEFKKTGIYNIGGKEFLSRLEFTNRIADYFKLDRNLITPITTEELNQPARRPLKSGLWTLKAETELGYKPHSISESLMVMKKELGL
ncbi:MAG: dTDP-4-dehydrorhamnose reductase [Ignavibacteriaceae bacterium]|nr:dTDP-4-dehydrorhamnose reductase [Ignavibacteriaceae bacterium]MCW8960340.1 dTDP-4-dehydrorhamnose reductase [Ignavibacteriaceae bacterium]MCW9096901.1 dTDP-4-dehydrorhamnose reductase [Ignavibacteriaceae bacterium]